jgi:NAD dependent epimerase/dehydratase family enzyme
MRLALGELAVTVLGGQKALSEELQRLGYQFRQPALVPALQKALRPSLST